MRLPGYDYSQPGWYFVTICTKNRREIFGVVRKGEMRVNQNGKIVMDAWQDLPNHYYCILDAFVIMPNHIHGVVQIPDGFDIPYYPVAAGLRPAATGREIAAATVGFKVAGENVNNVLPASLTEIVRALKSFSARRINELRGIPGQPVWQRSFHDHVLRGNNDIEMVREYIRLNPQKWDEDRNNVRKKILA